MGREAIFRREGSRWQPSQPSWPDDELVAATPHSTAPHWDADYRGSVAVVLGAEDTGLSPTWLDEADQLVRVPMSEGAADSLNVSVAGAVILFEAVRQRSLSGPRRS